MDENFTPTKAYAELVQIHNRVKEISATMEKAFDYSPFAYLPSKIERELLDIRKQLIETTARQLHARYMSNVKLNQDFHKLMTEKAGPLGFELDILETWFHGHTKDQRKLETESFKSLVDSARHFLPYVRGKGGYWGPCRNLDDIIGPAKEMLTLKVYTWRTASRWVPGSISYSVNSKGELEALEKLIDVITLRKRARTVRRAWLSNHLRDNRTNPKKFYGKHQVNHKAVKAFQFFKNSKFHIWFKTPEQALAVAKTLTTGKRTRTRNL